MFARQRSFRSETTLLLTLTLATALLAVSGPAQAETLYTAVLTGAAAGTPSPATGTASLTLNDAQTEVSYVIEYTGLLGVEFAAHIHQGRPGEFGPVLEALPLGSPKVGVWAVGPTEVDLLNQGKIYLNIHTDLYAGGEIRGDVSFQTVPNEALSFGAVKALFH